MATVEYDDILLNIGSRLQSKALDKAIENLAGMANSLKEIKDNDMKSTAQNIKEFTSSLKSVPASTVNSYKQLAKAMATISAKAGKATRELNATLAKEKAINLPPRISVAEKEKDNTIKVPGADKVKPTIQMIDLAKQRSQEQTKAIEETNKALAEQQSYWQNINSLAEREARKARTSWHHGRVRENNTVDLDPTYASSLSSSESASAWNETSNAIDRTTQSLQYYKDAVAKAKYDSEMQEVADEWEEIGKSIDMDISKSFKFTSVIENIKNSITGLGKDIKDTFVGAWQALPEVTNDFIEKLAESRRQATELEKQFARIAKYRIIRGIISGIVNWTKEGVKNLEEWDRNIGKTGFAEAMDSARNSVTALKNSLAVIVAPGLEFIAGVLREIASLAIAAANAISRFIAILGGKTSYRIVKYSGAVASNVASTAGSAKKATNEFKKQLMAFDEINNLTAPGESGSGGGGGGGGGSGLSDWFDTVDVGEMSKLEQWIDKFARKWGSVYTETTKSYMDAEKKWENLKEKLLAIPGKIKEAWDKFWENFDRKSNLNRVTFAENWSKAIGHLSEAWNLFVHGDFAGAAEEMRLILTDKVDKSQVAVDLYGRKWAEEQGFIQQGIYATTGVFDAQTGKIVTGFLQGTTTMENGFSGLKGKIDSDSKSSKQSIETNITGALNGVKSKIDTLSSKPHLITINTHETQTVTRYVNVYENIIRSGKSGHFATGGFPTSGQMFVAREAGPELVGTIGGHTAVANNDQIVAAVSQGVASAVASVMSGSQNVTVTLEGDAKGIFKVVQKEGRAYSARTGQPALA